MSQLLISRSPDLQRLQDEGYAIQIKSNHLLLNDVPYVTSNGELATGTLVSELTLAGNATARPGTHVAMFVGEMPCYSAGQPLPETAISSDPQDLGDGLVINHTFSRKPAEGYPDYYEKMITYLALISAPAQILDPTATARTFRVIENTDPESVFRYEETASSRAGISVLTEKLQSGPIAIIGLGGTGGYILDYLAKTPVREIHLFDGDRFLQHNAFRAPGAPSLETLEKATTKSVYFGDIYSEMRHKIFAHGHLTESNVDKLREMEFAFIAVDQGDSRRLAVNKLDEFGVQFIDVGMGLLEENGSLVGQLRVIVCTDHANEQIRSRIPYQEGGANDYSRNIQIAELNALNAAVAVIRWKRIVGFYADLQNENLSHYMIDGNCLINEILS